MSITDELRTWMFDHTVNCSDDRIALVAIADRIDEAHKHAIAYVDDRDPETMAENGWMRLPVDADGVPIHVGDVLDCDANGYKGTFSVFAIGDNVVVGNHPEEFCYKRPMDTFHVARYCRHHSPTVEDVLREFASDIADVLGGDDFRLDGSDELFAEYAAKLRLAGDGE